jgi:hypothetical protein
MRCTVCGKSNSGSRAVPSAAKEEGSYRSGKPLRHPKSRAALVFSASCLAIPDAKLGFFSNL